MKKIKYLNVVDLETLCWQNQIAPDGRPQREVSEIIEIGIVRLDLNSLTIVSKASYLVNPVDYPILSEYCTNLTGITNEMLNDKGTKLEYAISRMMTEFKTMKYEWASWGDYDRRQFEKECPRKNIQYPFHNTHLNLKYLLSLLVGLKNQPNVDEMLKYLHMEFEGVAHRGIDDAYNISKMFIEVMKTLRKSAADKTKIKKNGNTNFITKTNNSPYLY